LRSIISKMFPKEIKMLDFTRHKYFITFVFIFIMPLNGFIMAKLSIWYGLILALLQIPNIVAYVIENERKG